MPLLKIQTNVAVEAHRGDQLMKTASEQVATLLGKPEGFVMVVLETDVQMLFGGTPEPLVYIEFADAARSRWGWNGKTFER